MRRGASQRGMATLAVTLMLLAAMTLLALQAKRSLIVETQLAGHHQRAAVAFEAAEAGLDWATAMLADPRGLGGDCRPATGRPAFRVAVSAARAASVAMQAACRIGDGSLDCRCPTDGGAATLPPADAPAFTIAITPGHGDDARLQSIGCARRSGACDGRPAVDAGDAVARTSVTLRPAPLLRTLPASALTVAGAVSLDGPVTLTNDDASSGGLLVAASGPIVLGGQVTLRTVPGSPAQEAVVANDREVQSLALGLYGRELAEYAAAPSVRRLDGASDAARGAQLQALWAAGYQAFHAAGDVQFGSDIGSEDRPVLLVIEGSAGCASACRLHGLLHVRSAPASALSVDGALVVDGPLATSQPLLLRYSRAALERVRQATTALVRVPGSWHE